MDWPAVQYPFFGSPSDIYGYSFFQYPDNKSDDSSATFSSVALISGRGELELKDDSDWDKLFEVPHLATSPDYERPSGYVILLSARVKPFQEEITTKEDGEVRIVQPEIPAGLEYLPFSESHWRRISESFHLHNVICKAIDKGMCYSTFLVSKPRPLDKTDENNEPLELYTAVMSSEFPHNIAVSSTYFTKSKLTLSVVYGCSQEQMDRIRHLLHASPEVYNHPMLMAGVFAELYRDRLYGLLLALEEELDMIKAKFKLNRANMSEDERKIDWQSSRQLKTFPQKAKKIEQETRMAKQTLQDTIKRMTRQSLASQGSQEFNDYATSPDRFLHRFEEIGHELDYFISRCREAYEELFYIGDLLIAESNKIEAVRTARSSTEQAKASTTIASIATFFVPSATIAAIFSTPVFDFKNDWNDVRFRDASSLDTDNTSPNEISSNSRQPVLSGYFWIFLAISALVTLSLVFYLRHMRRKLKIQDTSPV